jgi:hypothetical protein
MSVASARARAVITSPPILAKEQLVRALVRAGRAILLVAVLVAALLALSRHWAQVQSTVWQLPWTSWLPSLLLAPVGILCATVSWQTIVDGLGTPVGRRAGGQVFLVSQLGKYLPGSIWAYLMQLDLGRKAGVLRSRVLAATVLSTVIAVVAALLAAAVALPALAQRDPRLGALLWLYLLVPVALVMLHPRVLRALTRTGFRLLRLKPPQRDLQLSTVFQSLLWALGGYICFGLHLWALVSTLPGGQSASVSLCVGTMAVGMLAGLFFFLLPSGIGVREAIIVTALTPAVGAGSAIAVAAISRVFLTGADLVTAGGAALLARTSKKR